MFQSYQKWIHQKSFFHNPAKCIGLKISPEKLSGIRTERLRSLGLSDTANYAKFERIKEELIHFEKVDQIELAVL